MICRICGEQGFSQTYTDPAEPCWCGEIASCSPWAWDRWRGVRKWLRYRAAKALMQASLRLTAPQRGPGR